MQPSPLLRSVRLPLPAPSARAPRCVARPAGAATPRVPADVPPCQGEDCAGLNCSWAPWGPWAECSRSCGVGRQQRLRAYSPPGAGGRWCPGILSAFVQRRFCSLQACKGGGRPGGGGSPRGFAELRVARGSDARPFVSRRLQWTVRGRHGAPGPAATARVGGGERCAAGPAPDPPPRTGDSAAMERDTNCASATPSPAVGGSVGGWERGGMGVGIGVGKGMEVGTGTGMGMEMGWIWGMDGDGVWMGMGWGWR